MATAGTTERVFPDADALAEAAAERIARAFRPDGASLVVTGGSTPGPAYRALARRNLPWNGVRLVLSDERWVPTDDPASNEGLLRRTLLTGPAAAARLTSLKTDARNPADALPELEARLAAMPRPFDLVLLGMGEDGHVASLFPGEATAQDLDPASPRSVAAGRSPDGTLRVSLTLGALIDSRAVLLLVRGDAKRHLIAEAAAGCAQDLPVAALIRAARTPVEVFWSP